MYESSLAYLTALRESKYLHFLEWPQFVSKHYNNKTNHDADDMLSLLIFEWLNNGFSEADVMHLTQLCSLQNLQPNPLHGSLAYALTSLSMAMFHCLVYDKLNIRSQFKVDKGLSENEVIRLMKQNMPSPEILHNSLNEVQSHFFAQVDAIELAQAEKTWQQLKPLVEKRYLVEDYVAELGALAVPNDELKLSRLSVAKSLASYLNEQNELTDSVQEQVGIYVAKIREMQPTEPEENYLNNLQPPSFIDKVWKTMSQFSIGFFNVLQKPGEELAVERHEASSRGQTL